jgi:hypothetical protein
MFFFWTQGMRERRRWPVFRSGGLALLEALLSLEAALVFLDPLGGELAGLDLLEDLAHRLAGTSC